MHEPPSARRTHDFDHPCSMCAVAGAGGRRTASSARRSHAQLPPSAQQALFRQRTRRRVAWRERGGSGRQERQHPAPVSSSVRRHGSGCAARLAAFNWAARPKNLARLRKNEATGEPGVARRRHTAQRAALGGLVRSGSVALPLLRANRAVLGSHARQLQRAGATERSRARHRPGLRAAKASGRSSGARGGGARARRPRPAQPCEQRWSQQSKGGTAAAGISAHPAPALPCFASASACLILHETRSAAWRRAGPGCARGRPDPARPRGMPLPRPMHPSRWPRNCSR